MPTLWTDNLDSHRRLVVERLLDAYQELRHTQGLDALTLSAVAARAGLARSAVYNYFDNKHDLVLTHAERAFEQATGFIRAATAAADTPMAALEAYVTMVLRHMDPGSGDDVMPMLTPTERERMHAMLAPLRAVLDEIMIAGAADGSLRGDPAAAADHVWAVLAGYRVDVATGRLDRGQTAAYVVDVLMRGLGTGAELPAARHDDA